MDSTDDASPSPGDTPGYGMGEQPSFLSAVDDATNMDTPISRKGEWYTRADRIALTVTTYAYQAAAVTTVADPMHRKACPWFTRQRYPCAR